MDGFTSSDTVKVVKNRLFNEVRNIHLGDPDKGFMLSPEGLRMEDKVTLQSLFDLMGKTILLGLFNLKFLSNEKNYGGYVDGTISSPDARETEHLAKWKVKNAQIMSWILGSVEPSMILNLRPYKTSKDMWGYLKKVYNQSNATRRFQLELELGQLSQGSMKIQEFYSSFENLWGEYTDIVYESVPSEGLAAVQSVHETSERDQFLMKL